jgi:hypothetical protein
MRSRVEALQAYLTEQPALWVALALITGVALIATLWYQPLLVAGAVAAAAAVLGVVARPKLTTFVMIFVIYTNAAAVAVKFHNVPYIFGSMAFLPLAIPLFYHLVVRQENIILTRTLPLIILFITIELISALLSPYPSQAWPEVLTSLLEGLLLYLAISNILRTETDLKQGVWALLAAGAFMGGLSGFQQLTGTFDKNYGGFAQVAEAELRIDDRPNAESLIRQPRLAGPVGEKNRYAQIMLMLIPLGLFLGWSQRSTAGKTAALGATFLIVIGWTLAFSRGSALAFMFLVLVMTVLGYIKARQVAAIALCGAVLLAIFPKYLHRLVTIPLALHTVNLVIE